MPPLPSLHSASHSHLQEEPVSGGEFHVLTLTPFYPSEQDEAGGCFLAEPLATLAGLGVRNSVIAAQPAYRGAVRPWAGRPAGEWLRYPAIPGAWGLASAGGFLFARIVARVRALHTRRRIDVIHAHAPLPCGHAAMLLGRELKIPFVVSVHGLDAYSDQQSPALPGGWSRRMTQRVFERATRILCISERVRERVLEQGSATYRTAVVYNSVDPELFVPASGKPDGISIVSVGNLIPIKGHALLLRALAAIRERHPDVRCNIVGSGPEEGRLRQLAAELKLTERVQFLGRRGRREVARLIQQATLFVLPSRFEGLGCVYLEAMSSGVAAIGCLGQGIEEVIRHGSSGWLIEPDNLEELSRALATLLENSMLREHIAAEGRETILRNFTLAHHAQGLLRIYQECVE